MRRNSLLLVLSVALIAGCRPNPLPAPEPEPAPTPEPDRPIEPQDASVELQEKLIRV